MRPGEIMRQRRQKCSAGRGGSPVGCQDRIHCKNVQSAPASLVVVEGEFMWIDSGLGQIGSELVDGGGNRWKNLLPWIATALALWCVAVAVRIELLNARAGHVLPRIPEGSGNPRWRVSANRFDVEIQLRTVVESVGLLQYLLAPIAVILCSISAWQFRRKAWCAAVFVLGSIVAAACLWAAFSRAYFTSLGW